MEIIKFSGKDKRDCIKKALSFYYDNLSEQETLKVFLAKCRIQKGEKVLHFYPKLQIKE